MDLGLPQPGLQVVGQGQGGVFLEVQGIEQGLEVHAATVCVSRQDQRIPPYRHTIRRQQIHSKTHEPPAENDTPPKSVRDQAAVYAFSVDGSTRQGFFPPRDSS
ncbi:hypothetical protein ACFWJU_37520 [Streptomyces mutabilis]|uniref:hypothetical protein n=1 Tax=Streptomyces mutabilis TaxID=67332 RepID=UPI00364DE947